MKRAVNDRLTFLIAPVLVALVWGWSDAAHPRPSLDLPTPTEEQLRESGYPAGGKIPNSVRAWHYNPEMVRPLLETGRAVDECDLPLEMRRMLAAVVASRNRCLY